MSSLGFRIIVFIFIAAHPLATTAKTPRCHATISALADHKPYKLSIGQEVQLTLPDKGPQLAHFLGRLLRVNGSTKDFGFFAPQTMSLHFVPQSFMVWNNMLSKQDIQPVPRSISQVGPTCAAFTIFNCIRQLYYWERYGNQSIQEHLGTEQDRVRMLARAINDYYIDDDFRDAIPNIFSDLGFRHERLSAYNSEKFKEELRDYLSRGHPVLLGYLIRSEMTEMPYELIDHKDNARYDRRLWLPKSSGEQNNGGHKILVVGVLETQETEYTVVVDPNWQAPRLWEMKEFDHLYTAGIRAQAIIDPNADSEDTE